MGTPILLGGGEYLPYEILSIKFCLLHAAAPKMLEALKNAEEWHAQYPFGNQEFERQTNLELYMQIQAAIAAAEPDFYQDEPSHAFTGEVSNIKTYPKVLSPEETLEEFEKGKVE